MTTCCQKGVLAQTPYLLLSILCMLLVLFHLLQLGNSAPHLSLLSGPQNEEAHSSSVPQLSEDSASILLHPEQHVGRPAKDIHLEWNLTKAIRRPDGVKKEVVLINDQFPGPTVEARSGDEIHITIRNYLDEPTAIHWHGLVVSNENDGVVGVTQCGIPVGSSFTYHLRLLDEQAGTFWYHSHSEVQRADGLFGAFIVHAPETEQELPTYGQDQVLMVGDWYHKQAQDVLRKFQSLEYFKNEIPPDSMLLNGQGCFPCENAAPASQLDCDKGEKPFLTIPQTSTRLRIVNVGAFTGVSIFTPGSSIRTIATDGGGLVHQEEGAGIGIIYPGERLDILLESDGSSQTRVLVVQLDETQIQRPNLALLPVQTFSLNEPATEEVTPYTVDETWAAIQNLNYVDYTSLEALQPSEMVPKGSVDQLILLYATLSYRSEFDNRPRGEVNGSTWTPPGPEETPLLGLPSNGLLSSPSLFLPDIKSGWVDVVLNNMDDKGHPFHLHGHSFYAMTRKAPSRLGSFALFNPFDQSAASMAELDYATDPVCKDTVHVPSRGHVVLRFKASPGLWMFHCHVLWHESVGMATAFRVGDSSDGSTWERLSHAAQMSCEAGG